MAEGTGEQSPPPASPRGTEVRHSAVVKKSTGVSSVWLIPIVAALTGGFLAWQAINEKGPEVTIFFDDAAGLVPEKTKIKFKEVEIGVVEHISITEDLDRVSVTASLVKEAAPHLNENTRFWVVRAQFSAAGVSGLDTLLGGVYIAVDLAGGGESQREFEGLPNAPLVTSDEAGTVYTLRSDGLGSLRVGAPLYYRSFGVGKVTTVSLDESGKTVTLQVFVEAPHDARVNSGTRFWNASGLDIVVNAEGVRIDTPSVVSMLMGGISFDDGLGLADTGPVEADTVFNLYPNKDASLRPKFERKVQYMTYFDQSVAGLTPGAPVEFRGIKLGQVIDLELIYNPADESVEIPVLFEIEPDRIQIASDTPRNPGQGIDDLVKKGLRARLATANLLTGALKVELDFIPNAEPAEVRYGGKYPEIPTAPDLLNQITNSVTQTLAKLEKVPIDEIGEKINHLLGELDGVSVQLNEDIAPALAASIAKLEQTLDSVDGVIGPDAAIKGEIERLLLDLGDTVRSTRLLAERLEQHPEDLLRGKSR